MSIAWRAILVAGLAAGEEATLASLTGLFQREPDRAAALVASAREGARAINQSRHSEGHETYFRQRRRIEAAVVRPDHTQTVAYVRMRRMQTRMWYFK